MYTSVSSLCGQLVESAKLKLLFSLWPTSPSCFPRWKVTALMGSPVGWSWVWLPQQHCYYSRCQRLLWRVSLCMASGLVPQDPPLRLRLRFLLMLMIAKHLDLRSCLTTRLFSWEMIFSWFWEVEELRTGCPAMSYEEQLILLSLISRDLTIVMRMDVLLFLSPGSQMLNPGRVKISGDKQSFLLPERSLWAKDWFEKFSEVIDEYF